MVEEGTSTNYIEGQTQTNWKGSSEGALTSCLFGCWSLPRGPEAASTQKASEERSLDSASGAAGLPLGARYSWKKIEKNKCYWTAIKLIFLLF